MRVRHLTLGQQFWLNGKLLNLAAEKGPITGRFEAVDGEGEICSVDGNAVVILPMDIALYARDVTDMMVFAEGDGQHIIACREIWLFDRNRQTHCAEISGSYEMHHVYDDVIFKDHVHDDEELRDRLDMKYAVEVETDPITYMGVRGIDKKIIAQPALFHIRGIETVPFEDVSYDEQFEALVDHYRGNHIL